MNSAPLRLFEVLVIILANIQIVLDKENPSIVAMNFLASS